MCDNREHSQKDRSVGHLEDMDLYPNPGDTDAVHAALLGCAFGSPKGERMRKPVVIAALAAALVIVVAGSRLRACARQGEDRTPAAAPTPTATPDAPRAFASTRLYLDPNTEAAAAQKRLELQGDTESSLIVGRIASVPTAVWLGEWFQGDRLVTELRNDVADAEAQQATPVFVAYAIPNRDCGGYSKGGLAADQYLPWIRTIASTLRGSHAVVLLEPDSLGMLADPKCDGSAEVRLPLLKSSVGILESAGIATYLDGGNARWLSADDQAVVAEAGRRRGRARVLHERLELRHHAARARLRRKAVVESRLEALRHRRLAQRQRLDRHLVQPSRAPSSATTRR